MSSLQPFLQANLQKQNFHPLLTKPGSLPFISSAKLATRSPTQPCLSPNLQPAVRLLADISPVLRGNRFPTLASNQLVNQSPSTPEEDNDDNPTLPPGPWKLPLIGNIHQLLGDLPHRRLRDLAKSYGPVMSIQLGEVPAVVISSVEAAKEVLRTQDVNFAERPPVLVAETVLYNRQDIVFRSYGDEWRQMRKICTLELLSLKRVQSFRSVREEEVSEFIKFLYSKAGTPVNLTDKLFALTNSIMLRTSIGKKCKDQEALLRVIDGVVAAGGGFSVADVFPSAKFLHDISGDKSSLESLHREADRVLEDIINEHKASRISGDHDPRGEADNLLDVLLDLQEKGDLEVPLNNDSIKGAILDMFGAGSDTSSKTAEWALSELIRHPEAMKKAQEEVREVFGEKGTVDEAGLNQLKYLKLVIKETLRLHPAIPLIPRECRERTKINGYDMYPKTKALVNVWAISRDPTIWSEAEKFYPERFENSSIDYKGNHCEYAPFGAGKRICPGMTLGVTNLELFLAQLLYHFDWKLPDGKSPETLDMSESVGGAIKRKIDLNLIPIPFSPLP